MWEVTTEKSCTAIVKTISWERILLKLEVEIQSFNETNPDEIVFYAVNGKGEAKARFHVLQQSGNCYNLLLNITNNGEIRCINEGFFWIVACKGERKLAICEVSPELVPKLEDCSRGFLYSKFNKVFSVTFFVDEGDDSLPLRMRVLPASKTGTNVIKTKFFHLQRISKDDKKNAVQHLIRKLYAFFVKTYRKKKETILFLSEQSTTLGKNQQAVIRQMQKRGLDQVYDILTFAKPVTVKKLSVKEWFTLLKKLAESDIIVVDDHVPVLDWLVLDKKTKVIQLWHAGAGFKSSGYSRWGHKGCPAPYSAHRQYDFGIAGSKKIRPFFAEVWGINEEQVLPTGMPRMDEYLDVEHRKLKTEEIYRLYPMCKGKKVILFAPTYRGTNKKTAYYPYSLIDFKKFYELCGDEYVVLFKMHPWVAEPVPIPAQYLDRFVDVNTYPDINDLFYVTDLLITDYSSNVFEYSLMNKPMLFFAFDEIQYSFSRGFHRPYRESAPGKVCATFDELLRAIAEKDFEDYKVREYVEQSFDHIDTHASDRVIDWLILGNLPNETKKELENIQQANAEMHSMDFTVQNTDESESATAK